MQNAQEEGLEMNYLKLCAFSAMLLSSVPCSAEVRYVPGERGQSGAFTIPQVEIFDVIRPTDYQLYVIAAGRAHNDPVFNGVQIGSFDRYSVILNSAGGDVATALKIGRHLRKTGVKAIIGGADSCMSSCVFILAGAQRRMVIGRVGIHRPYFPNDSTLDANAQQSTYAKLGAMAKSYLREMNIPESLWEQMMRIPGEKVRLLSQSELQDAGLGEDDPYSNEAESALAAKSLGLSKQQYLERKSRADRVCTGGNDVFAAAACVGRILRGEI